MAGVSSPGADVAGASPVSVQMWHGVSPAERARVPLVRKTRTAAKGKHSTRHKHTNKQTNKHKAISKQTANTGNKRARERASATTGPVHASVSPRKNRVVRAGRRAGHRKSATLLIGKSLATQQIVGIPRLSTGPFGFGAAGVNSHESGHLVVSLTAHFAELRPFFAQFIFEPYELPINPLPRRANARVRARPWIANKRYARPRPDRLTWNAMSSNAS